MNSFISDMNFLFNKTSIINLADMIKIGYTITKWIG